MQRFKAENLKNVYSSYHEPIGRVNPGEEFFVETEDCFGGRFRDPKDYTHENIEWVERNLDIVTGPIYVNGATPDQVVCVSIKSIEILTPGSIPLSKWLDPSPQDWWLEEYSCLSLPIIDRQIILNEKISLPVKPVIGCIATAPRDEVIYSKREGVYGGNLDCNPMGVGASIILPVFTHGGLLYFGDCKAAMADGEIVNAPEVGCLIGAEATLRTKPKSMKWPRVELPDRIITVVSDISLDVAARLAFRELMLWIEEDYSIPHNDVAMMMGMVAHTGICQISNTQYTARCEMPLIYLQQMK